MSSKNYKHVTQKDYATVAGPDWPSFVDFQQHVDIPDFVYNEIDQMLAEPVAFDHPSFCVLPFYGWEYPLNTACCLLPKKNDLKKIQADMLNGVRPDSCAKCWNLEDRGIKSDRQLKNETVDFYLDKNIQDLYADAKHAKTSVLHYKIDTSNTCNAACITCDSGSSSYWGILQKKNKQRYSRTWNISLDKIDQNIDYNTARMIIFRGGEPLLSKTNFSILQKLIWADNTECFISFQTNGSITPTAEQELILKHFKNLNFSFSIDGIGPVFEYLRYPLKWSDIEKNLGWCHQRNIMVSANYTLSNLNVLYHEKTQAWFVAHNINYVINPVYEPAWFSPSALPGWVKDGIDFNFINHHNDDENYAVFRSKIAEQDAWKNISMRDYLPELADLLG
jgi:organic radical activating enzyme